jgi:hypothetical protein
MTRSVERSLACHEPPTFPWRAPRTARTAERALPVGEKRQVGKAQKRVSYRWSPDRSPQRDLEMIRVTKTICTHLPDFCYQSAHVVLTMLERINENIPLSAMRASITYVCGRHGADCRPPPLDRLFTCTRRSCYLAGYPIFATGLAGGTVRSKDAKGFVIGDDAGYAFSCTMISLWEGELA